MGVKVGDVFHDGYAFFQVVKATDKTVTVRPIESEKVRDGDTRTAFDYDVVVRPKRDHFTSCYLLTDKQNREGKRCRIHQYGTMPDSPAQICINDSYRHWAYQLVGGDEATESHDYL